MPELLTLTGPIFALIGLGWLAVHRGWFERAQLPALGRFVIAFCLPALLWRALGQRNLAEVANGRYLAAYALGSLLVFALGWAWARARRASRTEAAMTAMGRSCSNSALGLRGGLRVAAQALWGLRRSTIVMGIAAGLLTSVARAAGGWELPSVVDRTVGPLAGAATAASLFYIGGNLVGIYPILGQRYGLQATHAACMLGATLTAFLSLGAVVALLKLAWVAPHGA